MSTPPSDDEPFASERELRADVHAAIERALRRKLGGRDRDITKLEEEKLAFLLIDEFDLDLTYSWYIAGANIKVGNDTVSTGPTGPAGPSLTDDEQRVDFGGVSAQVDDDRVQTFTDYLASETLFDDYELRKMWYTQRHEFLHDFYDEFAPEAYEEAYFASTEIRRRLANLDEDRGRQAGNTSLSQFGVDEQPLLLSSDEESFRHTVSELHFALARNEDLSETTESVTVGTDLIERTLDRLTRVQPSTDEQWKLIEELSEFFFYTVWRLPALVVSIQTAQGPNAGELRVQHGRKLNRFEDEMQRKHDNLRDRLADADLLPTLEEDRSSDINLTYKISLSDG
jgi:hypothetical protein